MGERGLLRSPVEEAKGERRVVEKEGVDDSSDELWSEGVAAVESMESLVE